MTLFFRTPTTLTYLDRHVNNYIYTSFNSIILLPSNQRKYCTQNVWKYHCEIKKIQDVVKNTLNKIFSSTTYYSGNYEISSFRRRHVILNYLKCRSPTRSPPQPSPRLNFINKRLCPSTPNIDFECKTCQKS